MTKLDLDFTIESSKDRANFVSSLDLTQFTATQLETISNYILYGKDADGTSVVDRHEVEIGTKYGSYKRKRPESLDELIESPTFDETVLREVKPLYKKIKPSIDKEKDASIPGMGVLWSEIEKIDRIVQVNEGKEEPLEGEQIPKLTSLQLYKLKHHLIDIRRDQYLLKDAYRPTICMYGLNSRPGMNCDLVDLNIPWDVENSNYAIAPLGVLIDNDLKFYNPREYKGIDYHFNENAQYILDFRNPLHIYYLEEHYTDLKDAAERDPESTIHFLLKTLDFYTQLANLNETKTFILKLRQQQFSNEEIRIKLEKELGVTHRINYISTIWKQQICEDIAEAAALHYDMYLYRNDKSKWKICNKCGEAKLRDNRNFMKRSRSSDGFSSHCKQCDKIMREERKGR